MGWEWSLFVYLEPNDAVGLPTPRSRRPIEDDQMGIGEKCEENRR